MNIDLVIAQLKQFAPVFKGNVAGGAAFEKGVNEQGWLPTPAAYVIILDEDGGENLSMTGLDQLIEERIGVIVDFDNSADRRGQYSISQQPEFRALLMAAILGWRPDLTRSARGFRYGGGQLKDWDRARLFYQYEFVLTTTVSDADGFLPTGAPLSELAMTIPATPPEGGIATVTAAVMLDPTATPVAP